MEAALRLGVAAGALNVTRHGLGSGTREEIERMAGHVELLGLDRAAEGRAGGAGGRGGAAP